MADVNAFYDGVVEYFDPKGDSGVLNPSTTNIFGLGGSNFWLEEMNFWPQLKSINERSAATIAAVKVEFTTGIRLDWLKARIAAIDDRAKFIKERGSALLDFLQSQSTDAYNAVVKGFTTALSLLPGIGPIIGAIGSGASASQQLQAYKTQTLITDYTKDLTYLAQLRAQLVKEIAAMDGTSTDETVSNAATAIPTWYYFVGAGVLIIFLLWLKKRQKSKRGKR